MRRATATLALSLAALLAGCGGDSYMRLSSGGMPPASVSTGTTVHVQSISSGSSSGFGNLLAAFILAGSSYLSDLQYRQAGLVRSAPYSYPLLGSSIPELDPTRRVIEHDCTRPIEDLSANLKCK